MDPPRVRPRLRHRAARGAYAALDNRITLPAFARADGALFYSFASGRTRLALNVKNLFDNAISRPPMATTTSAPAHEAMRLTLNTKF